MNVAKMTVAKNINVAKITVAKGCEHGHNDRGQSMNVATIYVAEL